MLSFLGVDWLLGAGYNKAVEVRLDTGETSSLCRHSAYDRPDRACSCS
jgi:hypothetical protein